MRRPPIPVAAVIALLVGGCSDSAEPSAPVASIAITSSEPVLAPVEASRFVAEALDSSGAAVAGVEIRWTSADATIAAVTAEGQVTAVSPGSTVLTAAAGGRETSVTVTVALNLRQLSIGGLGLCGFDPDGAAFCGPFADALSPIAVGSPIAQLSAGFDFWCGVTDAGAGICWGRNGDGQLGRGVQSGEGATLEPAPVAGGLHFQLVSAGSQHACGVASDGQGYCWGENSSGQLGNGSTARSLVPAAISGGHLFRQIDADLGIACGIATGGAAFCWGAGFLGSIGGTASDVPIAVAGNRSFDALSVGPNHSCAVASSGELFCWGTELGGGTSEEPTPVGGSLRFTSVSVSESTTCGLTAGEEAYCTDRFLAGPMTPFTQKVYVRLDAGNGGACAVTSWAAAFCSAAYFSPDVRPSEPDTALRVPLVTPG